MVIAMDYKEILKGIVQIINTTEKSDIGFANICTYIGENCPELQESEDERMRKEILEFVTIVADSKSNKMEWIAWLEKQGEKKSSDEVLKIRQEVYQSGYNDGYKHGIEDEKRGKPKWSEGDEENMQHCCGAVAAADYYTLEDKEEMEN